MNAANDSIPTALRNVFVNDDKSSNTESAAHFAEECSEILSVMEDIAKQDRIDGLSLNRKSCAIKLAVVNLRLSCTGQVNSRDIASEHCAKVMRDVAVATPDVQELRTARYEGRDLQSHVVSPANLPSPALAPPAARYAFREVIEQLQQPKIAARSLALKGCDPI